jgi:hypothetical protein
MTQAGTGNFLGRIAEAAAARLIEERQFTQGMGDPANSGHRVILEAAQHMGPWCCGDACLEMRLIWRMD